MCAGGSGKVGGRSDYGESLWRNAEATPAVAHFVFPMADAPPVLDTTDNNVAPGEQTVSVVPPDSAAANRVDGASPASQGLKFYIEPGFPNRTGPQGIKFDFNHGARVFLPARTAGQWRIVLRDIDTGNILFESNNEGASVQSSKHFYVRFSIEVQEIDPAGRETSVFSHRYDARDQDVLIQFPGGTLGDNLAWFPYAARFAAVHGCKLACMMPDTISPLLRDAYPDIRFVTRDEVKAENLTETAYATYYMGLFFDDEDCKDQPTDFRHVGLHRTAGYILGVDPAEEPARLALPDESRPIPEPYVCIAVQSSTHSKKWNNPDGWHRVVAFLKQRGYRVICIDQQPVHGHGLVWTYIPHGAEDETGNRPLAERARWLRHAAAFVGLSSGLAWLAWSAGAPVVMISGFTHPNNEFFTPYRIINWHTCNSCWNDIRHRFDHKDYLWCPRHADSPRQFECTRLITVEQVINVLTRVPTLPDLTPLSKEA